MKTVLQRISRQMLELKKTKGKCEPPTGRYDNLDVCDN